MSDIITILGAGPSGLSAAINLAKAGYPVEVFEKRSDAGKRFHGDFQLLENWSGSRDILDEFKRLHIDINFDCIPFNSQTITNGVRSRSSTYEQPLSYVVKRGAMSGSLDQGLKAQALAAGVTLRFNQTRPKNEVDIVATGPISREIFAVDKGIIFETKGEDTAIFLANDEAAFKGYAYLVIHKGQGCMCTVLFDKFKDVHACFERSQQLFSDMVAFDIRNPSPVGGIGSFSTRPVFQEDSRLFVGEAAGLQDLLWGFGIKNAILSGYLAARSIIQNQDYAALAAEMFDNKLKATLVGRFLWELIRFNNYALLVRPPGERRYDLSALYDFGSLQRLLYPLARLVMKMRYPNLRL